ncbi:hypothetical protein QNH20_15825 [Neobacillus sp. WH10]|uniref:hypothetical protein n=1 Tax=Neobacillus sp. WH10 TaxID=3047873 RepID=UPI0024C1AEB0|nr:hypothetical protein [Neobacillus sp. WH10]WHY75596.1 hypothetical protein QNH20_15825 [Neobacillus sp. WH10]
MNKYSNLLLKVAAVFGLIGAVLGGHMAGSGSYAVRPIHAHILVVGWLTLFAWAVYYRVFQPKNRILACLHVYSAVIGAVGLTGGMALYNFRPGFLPAAVETVFYIAGGAILLLSFVFFCILTFTHGKNED